MSDREWEQQRRDRRAARLRAAWAYSGLSYAELAELANVPVEALMKWCAHRGPRRGRATDAEAFRIADAAGVPRWFVFDGWDGAAEIVELVDPWIDGRLDQEIKSRWAALLRHRVEEHDPELRGMVQVLEAMDSLNPRESAAMRELLRYLTRAYAHDDD